MKGAGTEVGHLAVVLESTRGYLSKSGQTQGRSLPEAGLDSYRRGRAALKAASPVIGRINQTGLCMLGQGKALALLHKHMSANTVSDTIQGPFQEAQIVYMAKAP